MSEIISISDDVYTELTRIKQQESYSVVIRKLLHNQSNKEKILSFYGKGGIEKEKIKSLDKEWQQWSKKYV